MPECALSRTSRLRNFGKSFLAQTEDAMKIARMVPLFLMLAMPAIAAEGGPAIPDQGATRNAELRSLLNCFAALGEGHIEHVLRDLKLIAMTKEVQGGQWEDMKPLLTEFRNSGTMAAAVWFVRPDGAYYTVEKGLTGLNLRDRPYFPKLMAGEEVAGALVISKSAKERSAIVAVPVKTNGKVIGALGASLSVETISAMLDKKMALPANMFFYALDSRGQTSLHRNAAFLFAYPSDMGSKTLTEKVAEMLARPEGLVTYDFYGQRTVVFKKSPLTGWVFAIGMVTGGPGQARGELPPVLVELQKKITAELDQMDQEVARLAGKLSEKDFGTAPTRKMLGDLCRSFPYAVDCAVLDRNGRMVLVEPEAFTKFEGSDISAQEQVVRLQKTKKPALSNAFKAVEGFDAVDLEHPIFSSKGELIGSVSLLIRPEALFSHMLAPVLQGMPVEAFVMQTDGRILYDEDKEEVGRMLFTDSMYEPFPQLRALGTLICREKTGAGSYEFRQKGSQKLVKKDAHWTTVGLHGTEWRLVVMHVRAGHAGED
jgi:hypothetical protein